MGQIVDSKIFDRTSNNLISKGAWKKSQLILFNLGLSLISVYFLVKQEGIDIKIIAVVLDSKFLVVSNTWLAYGVQQRLLVKQASPRQ